MQSKLIIGNWKMNGSLARNETLLVGLVTQCCAGRAPAGAKLGLCVPYPYLMQARDILRGSSIAWGGQNVSQYDAGAYTGEVSAGMLQELGCTYVIVGHSERRSLFGETSEIVASKAKKALSHGLTPVVCVGETLAEREAGLAEGVVVGQLATVSAVLQGNLAKAVIAYEPVWAIGTGLTPDQETIQTMHRVIRVHLTAELEERHRVTIAEQPLVLYGGSLSASNSKAIFSVPGVDGGLIGGASLVLDDFLAIAQA